MTDLHPGWKNAAQAFFTTGFRYGDVIPHSWFWEKYNIKQPTDETPKREAQKLELERLYQHKKFEDFMLEEHQCAFKNVRGEGYQVVSPPEQTSYGVNFVRHGISKVIRKGFKIVANVDFTKLTPEQKQENTNALNRIAGVRSIARKELSAPIKSEDPPKY